MTVSILPIAQYLPDAPDFPATGSANIRNVVPRTPASYGPIGSPMPLYNALPLRCQGACAYRSPVGAVNMFAGDGTDLFNIVAADATWQNASKAASTYHLDPFAEWQFVYFNGDVIAVNFGDLPQYFTLGSSTKFADLDGGPPQARYATVVKNAFVALGNTFDVTNGSKPQRVWWCAAGNAHSWPTPGTPTAAEFQAGATDLQGDGGWIQGFADDLQNADAAVFMEYSVKQMIYTGPPTVFSFLPVESALGTPAPYSIVALGGIAYYLRQDGFCAFDGSNSNPIGANRVDKTFFASCADITRVVGGVDPVNRAIWWAYPTSAATANLTFDEMLCYNWQLDRWSIADISCETLVRMLSPGYTLDQLYTILGYTIDGLPAPLDSPIWQGGRLLFGIFDTSHTLNYLTGAPLAATVDTMEMQPFVGRRALLKNSRPLVDGVGVAPSVTIGRREQQQSAVAYTAPVPINSMGSCPVRTSGRYLRGRITTPAGAGAWSNISGIEVDVVQQGTR